MPEKITSEFIKKLAKDLVDHPKAIDVLIGQKAEISDYTKGDPQPLTVALNVHHDAKYAAHEGSAKILDYVLANVKKGMRAAGTTSPVSGKGTESYIYTFDEKTISPNDPNAHKKAEAVAQKMMDTAKAILKMNPAELEAFTKTVNARAQAEAVGLKKEFSQVNPNQNHGKLPYAEHTEIGSPSGSKTGGKLQLG